MSVCLFRDAEINITDNGYLHEEVTALLAGAFTVVTGALILYTNEKPPRQKSASRIYHIGGCILSFVSFALLIATLILFYSERSLNDKVVVAPQHRETLLLLINTAIVFAFILLFTMAILYILFISSCSKAILCSEPVDYHNHRHHQAERAQKYRYGQCSENWTTTDLGGSTTVQFSVDLPDLIAETTLSSPPLPPPPPRPSRPSPPCLAAHTRAPPLIATRKCFVHDVGANFSWSIDTQQATLQAELAAAKPVPHSV
ncbi:hypothetical protein BV898_07747 [Hypsibius exemplaris]|uniref:Uncharacterized protein n=1 Tax=Hypsibius exemplaris TaxID=2072580 RepID=A0A1W0WSH1_HYPEX|nr:hypothetical protein BV898_07747 [Hypsibius exemplaris]